MPNVFTPPTPRKDLKRTVGDAVGGAAAGAITDGLNQSNPSYQGMPTRTPSQVAGQIIPTAQAVGAGIGGNIAEGLNKVDPSYQGMPMQTPSQVAGRMMSGPPGLGQAAGAVAGALGRGIVAAPGAIASVHPAFNRPAPPPQMQGPQPVSFQTRPDFPQLNPQASMGGGMQLPRGPLAPQSTYTPGTPYDGTSSGEEAFLQSQGAMPAPAAPKPNVFTAPSGQSMVGMASPAPMLGPAAPPGLADRGMGAVRQLQQDGVLGGGRLGQRDPQMNQPIAADLRGPAPQAGVSGAADFYRNNGRLMTNEEAAANYRRAPADMKYQPNTTRGGAPVPTQQEFADAEKRSNERIARRASIARQGNWREAMLAEINFRGMENVKDPVKKPEHDFGMKSSGKFETDKNGRTTKKGGYSSTELQAQADAKAKFDARRGGLEKRREAYQERTAKAASDRKEGVLARAERRADSRAVRQNGLSFNERLAASDPRADASRRVGEAQVAAAASRDRQNDLFRRDDMAARERMATERNDAVTQAGRDRLSAEAIKNGQPDPFAPKPPEAKNALPSPATLRAMKPQDAYQARIAAGMDPAQAMEETNRDSGVQHNWVQRPEGPWYGATTPIPAPPAVPVAPPGSPQRARMGGGMQLPSKPQRPKGSAEVASDRYGVGSGYAF